MSITIQEIEEKAVSILLRAHRILLTGNWTWDMQTAAVFCSDVMAALPAGFSGTRAIFHPDDVAKVESQVASRKLAYLQFRVITTYGEIKTLTGESLTIEPIDEEEEEIAQQAIQQMQLQNEVEELQLLQDIYERTEKAVGVGVWWYNDSTHETWYSHQVYRIHGLPPQSLNAHLHTFARFIHPEDREPVAEFFAKAFKNKTPLHLEYRIQTASGERTIVTASQWHFSRRGEPVLSGTVQDITDQKNLEQRLEEAEQDTGFIRQQLLFDEGEANLGHWQVNLLTRKTVFSENYYRIFGLRPGNVPPTLSAFVNYIHPEDRQAFSAANKKILAEHKLPELDFRIIRPDGKLRYVTQRAKLVSYGKELVMMGTLQDVSGLKMLEKKVKELKGALAVNNFTGTQLERVGELGSWVTALQTGETKWSSGLYRLLGFKSGTIELSQKFLSVYVHADDQKNFANLHALALQEKQEADFSFRLILRGQVKQVKASLRICKHEEEEYLVAVLHNLTGEHQLRQQLHHQQQLAGALAENIQDRIFITDTGNTILLWNSQCAEFYKIKEEAAVGKNFFDVFPALKTEEEIQLFHRALKGEKMVQQKNRAGLGLGHYTLHMLPLWNEEQTEVTGIMHILHDVTKEVELRQSLYERLSVISSILEASVDRVIALDKNMNYLYWNKKAEEYYGLKKEELLGKNILEVFPSFVNDPSYNEFRQVLKGETIYIPARQLPEEEKAFFDTYLVPIQDEHKEVSGLLWIARDLSERLLSDKKQLEQVALLQSVFDASTNGIAVLTSVRNESGEIIDFKYLLANRISKEDCRRNDLEGELCSAVHSGFKTTGLFHMLQKVVETGKMQSMQLYYNSEHFDNWYNVTSVKLDDGAVVTFEDTTAEKKAAAEVEKNLAILKQSEELAGIGSWEYDIATRNFYWSDGMYRMFGMEQGTPVSPETYLEFTVEEDQEAAKRIVEGLSFNFTSFTETIKIQASGEHRTIKVKGTVITDKQGRPLKVVGIDLDVTDMEQAEKKIEESQHYLLQTTQVSPDAITIYDIEEKKPVYLNNCLSEWLGWTSEELSAMGYEGRLALIHPEDREALFAFNQKMFSGEANGPAMVEYRLRTKSGNTIWVRNRSKVFKRDAAGKPVQLLTILQDSSEEVNMRGVLMERTRFVETLIDNSTDRILAFDKNYRLVAWNKRCEEIYHQTRDQVLGRSFFEQFPKLREDPFIMASLEKAFGGEAVHVIARKEVYHNAFSEVFFIPLLNEWGEVHAVLNVLHDVSKLYHAQEELKQLNESLQRKNIELEQKNEEITSFAFVASHDLQEPLRKIHTFSDWILQKESDQLSTTGKNYLSRMNHSVKRLSLLIDDILALTQIHGANEKVEEVDLNSVLFQVKSELAKEIKAKKAIITADDLPKVKGRKRQLFFLFRNLLSNALKFQPEGAVPKMEIRAEVIHAPQQALAVSGDYVKISFIDNGIGFHPRYKKKVFQIFQRLSASNQYEGTGMGLAICKKIMDNHNGMIDVDSEEGKGASFYCFFPAEG